jgi:hypothetical protein
MELSLFGKKSFTILGIVIHFQTVLISMVLFALLGCHLICGCSRISLQEGFGMFQEGLVMINKKLSSKGAELDYKMGSDIDSSWSDGKGSSGAPVYLEKDYESTEIPLPEGQLDFFKGTQFKPECCPSTVSTSTGCACLSKDQIEHINTRGGNRTSGNF